eukprot:GHVU01023990.1.p2 GENE.GHVU01023990.1~~GHVU01023990.1.p2  ORF type:complete len:154 (-),score=10.15 GHVU01023990.1:745-1206(-)
MCRRTLKSGTHQICHVRTYVRTHAVSFTRSNELTFDVSRGGGGSHGTTWTGKHKYDTYTQPPLQTNPRRNEGTKDGRMDGDEYIQWEVRSQSARREEKLSSWRDTRAIDGSISCKHHGWTHDDACMHALSVAVRETHTASATGVALLINNTGK